MVRRPPGHHRVTLHIENGDIPVAVKSEDLFPHRHDEAEPFARVLMAEHLILRIPLPRPVRCDIILFSDKSQEFFCQIHEIFLFPILFYDNRQHHRVVISGIDDGVF